MSKGNTIFLIIMIFLALLAIMLIVLGISEQSKIRKSRKQVKQKKMAMGVQVSGLFEHFYGLPLSDGVQLRCYWCNDRVVFEANGSTYNLPFDNLIDVCSKSDVEIQKEYVSSTKKAVAGAVIFGPVGAIIASKPKVKEIRTATPYLIFTYRSKNGSEIKYIALKILPYNVSNPLKFINAFKMLPPKENISFDL